MRRKKWSNSLVPETSRHRGAFPGFLGQTSRAAWTDTSPVVGHEELGHGGDQFRPGEGARHSAPFGRPGLALCRAPVAQSQRSLTSYARRPSLTNLCADRVARRAGRPHQLCCRARKSTEVASGEYQLGRRRLCGDRRRKFAVIWLLRPEDAEDGAAQRLRLRQPSPGSRPGNRHLT
jgi:hypothetical protein